MLSFNKKKCWLTFTLIQMMASFDYFKEANGQGIIDTTTVASYTENCIMKMVRENFKRNTTVTIFSSNSSPYRKLESNLIKNIFDLINCSVVLYNTSRMTYSQMTPLGVRRNFLIMLGDESLKATLGFLHSFYVWDSNAVFLVVVGNLNNQKGIVIENDTQSPIPPSHVLVVEYVSLNLVTENYISVPSRIYRKNIYEKLKKIGSCSIGKNHSMNSKVHSESQKELRVGAIHAPPFLFISETNEKVFGSEAILINTIAERLNMTVDYQHYSNMDNLGDLYVSNEQDVHGSGMLNDLLLNDIDIAVGNIVMSDKVSQKFAASTSYAVDRLVWILPHPRAVLKLPIFPFIHGIRMSLFLMSMYCIYPYLAFRATNHFRPASNEECSRYRTFRGTCITFFAMSTGSTVDIYPKTTKMRFFLFIWLFYTFHLNQFFGSKLIDFFAVEQYSASPKTIDELMASGMELGIDQRTFNYFKNYLSKETTKGGRQHISSKLFDCNSTSECLSKIVRDRNLSMTLSSNYFTYAKQQYRDERGKFLLSSLPQAIVSVPIGIVSKKGFVMQQKINAIILKINEAGLFDYWNENIIHLLKLKRIFAAAGNDDRDGIDVNYALKYSDLTTVFIGIGFELVVCSLVFFGELFVHKCNTHARMKRLNVVEEAAFDYVN